MMFLALFLVLAVAALVFFWKVVRGQVHAIRDWDDLPTLTEPVDIAAFRNLTDPEEDAWLRRELPRADYLQVRRERLAATAEYLGRTSRNAAVLISLGQAAMASADAGLSAAGRDLVGTALWTRLYTLQARARVRTAQMFPAAPLPLPGAVAQYQRLLDRVDRVGRLRNPVLASRLADAL